MQPVDDFVRSVRLTQVQDTWPMMIKLLPSIDKPAATWYEGSYPTEVELTPENFLIVDVQFQSDEQERLGISAKGIAAMQRAGIEIINTAMLIRPATKEMG